MLDPTLVEQKKPIILGVIAMINQKVESTLRGKETSQYIPDQWKYRREWEKVMKDIASGLIAIENVGGNYSDKLWQDEDYIMHSGLRKVEKSNNFELSIQKMISKALEILDKKAFILAFDDIDVDINQGWNVMETLRRYLADQRIITIVSGDIKLYEIIVRSNLTSSLPHKEKDSIIFKETVNELESQYMLKILKPNHRIHLKTIKDITSRNNVRCIYESKTEDLKTVYKSILVNIGIQDKTVQQTFMDFLLSMSLRSQINFILKSFDSSDNIATEIFYSHLLSAGVNILQLQENPESVNVEILTYLLNNDLLSDNYLLLPSTSNRDTNSNLTGLTFYFSHSQSRSAILFDYMLRIGYLRNVVKPIVKDIEIQNIVKYAGWNLLSSLKNSVGLTIAFIIGNRLGGANEIIHLSGLQQIAKKKDTNAIDHVLSEEPSSLKRLLAMFPFVRLVKSDSNGSESYYSIIVLLGVIGELLKCEPDQIIGRINDLRLFRSYPMPVIGDNNPEDQLTSVDIEIEDSAVTELADKFNEWRDKFKDIKLPPYTIARIMTRLYTSASNIKAATVGDKMQLLVAIFINACLIEESRNKSIQAIVNTNNPTSSTKVFINNLVKTDILKNLPFTRWILACPILNCFLDKKLFALKELQKIYQELHEKTPDNMAYSVYSLLCQLKDLHNFSGAADKWEETLDILKIKLNDIDIKEKIINVSEEEAVKNITELELFKNVNKSSVKAFITAYKKKHHPKI